MSLAQSDIFGSTHMKKPQQLGPSNLAHSWNLLPVLVSSNSTSLGVTPLDSDIGASFFRLQFFDLAIEDLN